MLLGTHLFLADFGFAKRLSPVQRLAALFAAALHDVGHPGTTNGHEVKASSELAVRYNDSSALENYHCATAFSALLRAENNFVAGLGTERFAEFRKAVIKMILATDLAKHFEITSQLKSVPADTLLDAATDLPLVLQVAIKFADVGHTMKPWEQHERWSQRVSDEMLLLGDKEREMQLPISPLCDRNSAADTALAENQIKFLDVQRAPTALERPHRPTRPRAASGTPPL